MTFSNDSDVIFDRCLFHARVRTRTQGDVYVKSLFSRKHRLPSARERTCLDVLKGFAIPTCVDIDPREVRGWPLPPDAPYVATRLLPGFGFCEAATSPLERLGLWLAVVEHLAAFRKIGIVYCDIKCDNVLISRDPPGFHIIDFGEATTVSELPRRRQFSYTPGFQAPEQMTTNRCAESVLVFQACATLACAQVGFHASRPRRAGHSVAALRTALAGIGARGLATIVASGLSPTPDVRPANYEELFDAVMRCTIPQDALDVWRVARAPYASRLEELGMTEAARPMRSRRG